MMWDGSQTTLTSFAGRPINSKTGYSYSIKGGPAAARPPKEFLDSQREVAPPVRPPPRNPKRNIARDNAETPAPPQQPQTSTVSNSGFSRSKTTMAMYGHQDMVETISPPSSPGPEYTTRRPSDRTEKWPVERDVSPLDDDRRGMPPARGPSRDAGREAHGSHGGQQPVDSPQGRPNIPQMRRMRRQMSDAALREAQPRERLRVAKSQSRTGQQQGEVRYDAMTGEMTNSSAGRVPAVKPAGYAQGLGISSGSPSPTQQRSPSEVMTSFGNRVRRMAQGGRKSEGVERDTDPAARAFNSSRPGWRGASGRTTLVEPVHDTLEVAPLNISPKHTKRITTPSTASPVSIIPIMGRAVRGQTPPVSPQGPGAETGPAPRPRENARKSLPSFQVASQVELKQKPDDPRYPSPPLSGSIDGTDAPSVAAKQLQSAPTHNTHHAHQESVSSVYSQISHAPGPPALTEQSTNNLVPNDPWVQPPSRFSVTTYAPSTIDTPRESLDDFDHDRPPVPETPEQYRSPPQPPQDHSMSPSPFTVPPPSNAAIQRKAAATGTTNLPLLLSQRTRAARPDSVASDMNKSLPPPPPETGARDRVAMINAQLQSLGNRRINIHRSIRQMTELMPTDSIMNSGEVVRKREAEKRKVEALRTELNEVRREEYELGLKLHRAYKRMDRDATYEPTTLWVRRVTG